MILGKLPVLTDTNMLIVKIRNRKMHPSMKPEAMKYQVNSTK